jgi:PAS domain S-box-containing protein
MDLQDPEFFKQLLDHISDGVYFVDRERRITYWNEGACRLTGYSASEIVGRQCQDDILCHVDYEGKSHCQRGCPLAAAMAEGRGQEATMLLRHKQGRRVPVRIRIEPTETWLEPWKSSATIPRRQIRSGRSRN